MTREQVEARVNLMPRSDVQFLLVAYIPQYSPRIDEAATDALRWLLVEAVMDGEVPAEEITHDTALAEVEEVVL